MFLNPSVVVSLHCTVKVQPKSIDKGPSRSLVVHKDHQGFGCEYVFAGMQSEPPDNSIAQQ